MGLTRLHTQISAWPAGKKDGPGHALDCILRSLLRAYVVLQCGCMLRPHLDCVVQESVVLYCCVHGLVEERVALCSCALRLVAMR